MLTLRSWASRWCLGPTALWANRFVSGNHELAGNGYRTPKLGKQNKVNQGLMLDEPMSHLANKLATDISSNEISAGESRGHSYEIRSR